MERRAFLLSTAISAARMAGANDHIRGGIIGSGGRGQFLTANFKELGVEMAAVCDVYEPNLQKGLKAASTGAKAYDNYKSLLEDKSIDVVVIATPDHWHAQMVIDAVEAGKDVYVEKPMVHVIDDGFHVIEAVRRTKRVVQVGTQRRSTPHLFEAREIIQEGRLGRIGLVETYCYGRRGISNPPDEPPPEYLDYEMWTGPAPMRPYHAGLHPRSWRDYMEYGNGTIGDMGIHMVDMARWMMGLGWPKRISSTGGNYFHKAGKPNIPDMQTATFDYGDLQITWEHRHFGGQPDPKYWWGADFYGEKATLKASVFMFDFMPLDGGGAIHREWNDPNAKYPVDSDKYPEDKTEKGIEYHVAPAIREHMKDLLQCIASRGRPRADIAEGSTSTSMCVLANLSLQLKRSLAWDEAAGRVVNDEEANRLLARSYRTPWSHPAADAV